MKLIDIKAYDFMRYSKIELTNLPANGLFTIRGENESGKSTIGHLIFFALSGQSFYGGKAEELIHWEGNQLRVELQFSHDGKNYQIHRQVDRDGSNFSKMLCGSEVIAQGNPEVHKLLLDILGYDPKHMQDSCLITHKVIQSLQHNTTNSHVKFMVGIDSIESLVQTSNHKVDELVQSIQKMHEDQVHREEEQGKIGYNEEEEIETEKKCENLEKSQKELLAKLEEKKENLEEVQFQCQSIESEGKILPNKIDDDHLAQLNSELPHTIEKLKKLPLTGKSQELMNDTIDLLGKMDNYQKSVETLSDKFEHQLNQYRNTLGINQENNSDDNEESFASKEKKLKVKHTITKTFHKLCRLSSLCTLSLSILCLVLYIKHPAVLAEMRSWPFIESLRGGAIHQAWIMIKNVFRPGESGLPINPKAYIFIVVLGAATLISLFCWIKSSVRKSKLESDLDELDKDKNKIQDEYHALLAADFKEMNEVSSLIDNCHQDELKSAFSAFKNENEFYVENQFKTDIIIQQAKRCFEEVGQSMNVRAHEVQLEIQDIEESIAKEKNQLNEITPVLQDILSKKEQFFQMQEDIAQLKEKTDQEKTELTIQQYIKELASSCQTSMLSKLTTTITNLYKAILPLVTDGRYASISLDEDFKIKVFSEERNHFVPLENLSSGTNDLFVLIFQVILVHCFMESRRVDQHFLFLDEPLLAVDGERYQKLSQILPRFSEKLNQIFLCRPPENSHTFTHVIETSIKNKELVIDFSMAHVS